MASSSILLKTLSEERNDILNIDEKPLSTFMLAKYGWDLKGHNTEVGC